jgi:tetratricopeptide (TPR) repeat protein
MAAMTKTASTRKDDKSSQTIWALVIFAVAFIVRLVYLFDIHLSPLFNYLTLDPLYYHQLAQKIAVGQIAGNEVFFKAPLYPYFLGLIYAIFGDSTFTPRVFQSLFGSVSCALTYLIARRFYPNKIAVTAGFVAAFYGMLIFYDNELLLPAVTLVLNLLALWLLFKYEDRRSGRLLFASGFLLGLSSIARPDVLIFVPVALFWLYKFIIHNRQVWWRHSLIYILGIVVLIVPVAIRNYVVGGEVVVFGTYGGLNFAIGNNERSDGRTAVLPGTSPEFWQGYYDAVNIANEQSRKSLTPGEVGDFWLRQGIKYIFSHPIDWIGLELRKLVYMVSGYEISNNKHIYFFAGRSSVLKPLLWDKIISFPFGLILPLALLAPLSSPGWRRRQFLLYGYVVSYTLAIIIFFVTARYRLAIVPILIIWGSAGFWGLLQLYRSGQSSRFYRWGGVLVAGLLICNGLSYIPALSPRMTSDYEGYLFSGTAYYSAGKYADAEKEFSTAVSLNPRSSRAFNNLANACARLGKDDEAIKYLERSLSFDPNYELPKKGLAALYLKKKNVSELSTLLADVIKKNPRASWALHKFGELQTLLNDYQSAADFYERAYQADTSNVRAVFLKGECYLRLDSIGDAEREFLRYLQLVPGSIEAHANLGQVYARQSRFDQALQQFTMVANSQSTNPASYFNLASLYSQMKQFDKADEMLNKAASLDPTFPQLSTLREMIAAERAQQSGTE